MDRPVDAVATPLDVAAEKPWTAHVHLCTQRWDALRPTDEPRVRHCGQCDRSVVLVVDLEGYRRAVVDHRCVAVEATKPGVPERAVYLGDRPQGDQSTAAALTWD